MWCVGITALTCVAKKVTFFTCRQCKCNDMYVYACTCLDYCGCSCAFLSMCIYMFKICEWIRLLRLKCIFFNKQKHQDKKRVYVLPLLPECVCHWAVSSLSDEKWPIFPTWGKHSMLAEREAHSVTFCRGPSCPGAQTRANVTIFISPCIDLTLGCSNSYRTPLCPLWNQCVPVPTS